MTLINLNLITFLKIFLRHYIIENENITFDMIIQFFEDNLADFQGLDIIINVLRICINEIEI